MKVNGLLCARPLTKLTFPDSLTYRPCFFLPLLRFLSVYVHPVVLTVHPLFYATLGLVPKPTYFCHLTQGCQLPLLFLLNPVEFIIIT